MKEELLNSLLLRPGLEGREKLLSDMLDDCIGEVRDLLNYQEDEDIPRVLYGVIKEITLAKFNRDGAQGISSESQSSGGSVSYMDDLTPQQKAQIRRHRRLRGHVGK